MEKLCDIVFIHMGNDCIYEMKYNLDSKYRILMNKPTNGFWGCKYTPDEEYKSSWDRFNSINNVKRDYGKYVLFKVKKNAPILILDDINKIDDKYIDKTRLDSVLGLEQKLLNTNPSDPEFHNLLQEYFQLNSFLSKDVLNWSNILADFKGVYLTEKVLYGPFHKVFSSWDVESIVLFDTSVIESLEEGI